MGRVIWWMARNYPQRRKRAIWFCRLYVATRFILNWSGGALAPQYGYALWSALSRSFTHRLLLYLGIPTFLNVNREED